MRDELGISIDLCDHKKSLANFSIMPWCAWAEHEADDRCIMNFAPDGQPAIIRWDPVVRTATLFGIDNTFVEIQLPQEGPNTVCSFGLWVTGDSTLDIACDW